MNKLVLNLWYFRNTVANKENAPPIIIGRAFLFKIQSIVYLFTYWEHKCPISSYQLVSH